MIPEDIDFSMFVQKELLEDFTKCYRGLCFHCPSKSRRDTSSAGLLMLGTQANQGSKLCSISNCTTNSTYQAPNSVAPAALINELLAASLSREQTVCEDAREAPPNAKLMRTGKSSSSYSLKNRMLVGTNTVGVNKFGTKLPNKAPEVSAKLPLNNAIRTPNKYR